MGARNNKGVQALKFKIVKHCVGQTKHLAMGPPSAAPENDKIAG